MVREKSYKKYLLSFFLVVVFFLFAVTVLANSYIADVKFTLSRAVYTAGERMEIKGSLSLSNYTSDGTIVTNHTAVINRTVNVSIINRDTSAINATYTLNTSESGEFYSQSDFYPTALLVTAPSGGGRFYFRVNYTDPNLTSWWTQMEFEVINVSVDWLEVSGDKVTYNPSQTMFVTVEAVREIGDRLTYVANISINGSIQNRSKDVLSTFNCTTGNNGKCVVAVTAPSDYGDYYMEVNNFKAFAPFTVIPFSAFISMKDELGKSIKHQFDAGEQASVEVGVITNSTSETYTFDGVIKDSANAIVKNISSTTLNTSNSYTNRFTSTLEAVKFPPGVYQAEVNVSKSGDGKIQLVSSFEVRSWSFSVVKREVASGFDYEYSGFPNTTVFFDVFPIWRSNGTLITSINATTAFTISLLDALNNQFAALNATWNATCGKEGCYQFNLSLPTTAGLYSLSVALDYNSDVQTLRRNVRVIGTSLFAQSTDEAAVLKDLFGANEYAYLTVSGKNKTASFNMSDVSVTLIQYFNGTEFSYTKVNTFNLVNTSNTALEWAWNASTQQVKLDTPGAGGFYTVYLSADNSTAATSTRFIVNPYDVCLVAKNTPGQAGGSTGYYYAYQFKTTDTIYFELKIAQANNPTGRAAAGNSSNASYGMGAACTINTQAQQVVNNATITVEEVMNTRTGKVFPLNTTDSSCQADDSQGGYTCTVRPNGVWDGGSYGVKFKILSQDKQTSDVAYGGFDARAFYIYAWPANWRNKPHANLTLNVYMYEAGSNWWGNYGSGGLAGTISLQKVEYQGRDGEWIWPPIEYDYNVSRVGSVSITNGQGTLTLPVNNTLGNVWKTGSYRAILKGTDNGGTSDYGYAWFQIKQWEVYASPIDCAGGTCTSAWNINSRKNISLYVTINNAGEWGQSGNSLGSNVTIRVKKVQDCRKWPCTDLNSTAYNATSIVVDRSSGWYWSGTINHSYMINLTPTTGTWGTGYWQVVFDVNSSETGTGWFNTVAFYVDVQPSDKTGTRWKYSIKNNETMFFNVKTVKSQRGGYYYGSYATTDYLNTTIDGAILRTWNQTSFQMQEYVTPTDFNVTLLGGGGILNGSVVVNVTRIGGRWASGYYWGELSLRSDDNETATGWLWFQVRPFRVSVTSNKYSVDRDACVNGTLRVYEPDWTSDSTINTSFNMTGVTEQVWSASGSSVTTYRSYSPNVSFVGNSSFSICPNNGRWGTGSWGNYHYLTLKVVDSNGNTEDGWLSFRTVPFSISWGSIQGGTSVLKSSNIVLPVTLTRASSGAATSGNITKIYQSRWENYRSSTEEYSFSIGDCDTRTSGVTSCMVNGTKNVTVYAPSGGWRDGYNYLYADWTEWDDKTAGIQDYSGIWFNGKDVYSGSWYNTDANGTWKYYFAPDQNLTVRLSVRTGGNNPAYVNVTEVSYSTPSTTCWSDYCRTYTSATYTIIGQGSGNLTISDNGIIHIAKPSGNWSRGNIYFKATVSGQNGTSTIGSGGNGHVFIKDFTVPNVTGVTPLVNVTINTTAYWINWTTSEDADCSVDILSFNNYRNWVCGGWNTSNGSSNSNQKDLLWVDSCNTSKYSFAESSYYTEYIRKDYRSWYTGLVWGWSSATTGLVTGGTTHYYNASTTGLVNQHYGIRISCADQDWNYDYGYATVLVNVTTETSNTTNVTLVLPLNNSVQVTANTTFNYTFNGPSTANCSLYGNFSGSWKLNVTNSSLASGSQNFTLTLLNGTYLWNVYCIGATNGSNVDWAPLNWTLFVNITGGSSGSSNVSGVLNVSLLHPANSSQVTLNPAFFNYSFTGPATANCSLYDNSTSAWSLNSTMTDKSNGTMFIFNSTLRNLTWYLWNVYCVDARNGSSYDWGNLNRTFFMNLS